MASKKKPLSSEHLKAALNAIDAGTSLRVAARNFDIAPSTLHRKKKENSTTYEKMGPPTILCQNEETTLANWVLYIAQAGFPATKNQLLDSVQKILNKYPRKNPFTNNRPGRHWYTRFLERNPIISERMTQNLTRSRSKVTEKNIRDWFSEILEFLNKNSLEDVIKDPSRIFNLDESAFFLSPKGQNVLARKGEKAVYTFISNDEKECLTTLVGGNADGKMSPTMIVFPYVRIPQAIVASMPKKFAIGKTESGWMTAESFYEYIANIFHPWILKENIKLPIILFVDGHTSHVTMDLTNFCKASGIILVSFYPNATHILQPMDVGVFHPLKLSWKNAVQDWRFENKTVKLNRESFAPLLNKVLDATVTPLILKNSFRACGLYPFNADAVNYSKIIKGMTNTTERNEIQYDNENKIVLRHLEKHVGATKVAIFNLSAFDEVWYGDLKDESIFFYWRSIYNSISHPLTDVDTVLIEVEVELPENVLQFKETVSNGNILDPEIIVIEKTPEKSNNENAVQFSTGTVDDIEIVAEKSQSSENKESESDIPTIKLKDANINNVGFEVPTPFKTTLFWPNNCNMDNTKPKRPKVPSVATSEQWMELQQSKIDKKAALSKEKIKRQLLREEKKVEQNKKHEIKKNKPKVDRQGLDNNKKNDAELIENMMNDENIDGGDNDIGKINNNTFVIVEYEDEFFPGVVIETGEDKYYVSVMVMSGIKQWKWPKVADKLWYEKCDIKKIIRKPKVANKRGNFIVDEMSNFSSYE